MFNTSPIHDIIFNIEYGFCVSKFLQDKLMSKCIKYVNMVKLMKIDDIKIFYGDDIDYFDMILTWIII